MSVFARYASPWLACWLAWVIVVGLTPGISWAAPARRLALPPALARPQPRDDWDFKYKGFVIGAWWGPGATDAEMKLYKDAGFNVVMCGRYMQLDRYGDIDSAQRELDMAHRHGLWAMFDTYTHNDRPWGGKMGPTDSNPTHHPASLIELKWLYQRVGKYPALLGFLIGDDQGSVSQRTADCTQFLHNQKKPQLIPWLCGWISPSNLADHDNPFADPQIYPTLYSWGQPAEELARQYCDTYAQFSEECQKQGVAFWPMFNTTLDGAPHPKTDSFGPCPSDSLVRFPAYAALAYGAEGIWYFTYNGGALEHSGDYRTAAEARKALTPLYAVAKEANLRIASWGSRVMGRTASGVFATAFTPEGTGWPFPEDVKPAPGLQALAKPTDGKLLQSMDPDLIAGILIKKGQAPLAMVVDCRVSKNFGDLPSRQVTLRFAPAVQRIVALNPGHNRTVQGSTVQMTLQPGGGQMLELEGQHLDALCTSSAIHAPNSGPTVAAPARLTSSDLAGIRAARLRIDVFGSNGGQYAAKYIEINGHRLGQVPVNDTDSWTLAVVPLTPEELAWIRPDNEVTVRTESADAWKFRNVCLAVQLASGVWAKTNLASGVHSVPNWAYSEGAAWGKDGVAGPLKLSFPMAPPGAGG